MLCLFAIISTHASSCFRGVRRGRAWDAKIAAEREAGRLKVEKEKAMIQERIDVVCGSLPSNLCLLCAI